MQEDHDADPGQTILNPSDMSFDRTSASCIWSVPILHIPSVRVKWITYRGDDVSCSEIRRCLQMNENGRKREKILRGEDRICREREILFKIVSQRWGRRIGVTDFISDDILSRRVDRDFAVTLWRARDVNTSGVWTFRIDHSVISWNSVLCSRLRRLILKCERARCRNTRNSLRK